MYKPYMISYDLNNPGQKYDKVFEIIKEFGAYIKLQKSFWLVKTNLNPNQMCEKLNTVLDNNDSLFICELQKIIKVELQRKIGNSLTNIFSLSKD